MSRVRPNGGRALLEEEPKKVELSVCPIPIKPAPQGLTHCKKVRSRLDYLFGKNSRETRWVPNRYYRKKNIKNHNRHSKNTMFTFLGIMHVVKAHWPIMLYNAPYNYTFKNFKKNCTYFCT
jgi:hypothetical protein